MSTRVKHCELRHLMVLTEPGEPFPAFYGHVHEDEALMCAGLVHQGWPDPSEQEDDR